ncbi:hypothetical protein KIPB_015936, partial [Kipferlia bialata]|eukprot:g15936.t1
MEGSGGRMETGRDRRRWSSASESTGERKQREPAKQAEVLDYTSDAVETDTDVQIEATEGQLPRTHQCVMSTCDEAFQTLDLLHAHYKDVHDDLPYQCP